MEDFDHMQLGLSHLNTSEGGGEVWKCLKKKLDTTPTETNAKLYL